MSWRKSAPGPAPSARRTAISRWRSIARVSAMLPTFASATSIRKATAPNSSSTGWRAWRVSRSAIGTTTPAAFS